LPRVTAFTENFQQNFYSSNFQVISQQGCPNLFFRPGQHF